MKKLRVSSIHEILPSKASILQVLFKNVKIKMLYIKL
jgi:hypothetical protein